MKRRLIMMGVAAAAVLGQGAPAFADGEEDVLSGFDGDAPMVRVSNVSVLPVQMCNSGVAVAGFEKVLSPQKTGNCTNAPTGDPVEQLITNSTVG